MIVFSMRSIVMELNSPWFALNPLFLSRWSLLNPKWSGWWKRMSNILWYSPSSLYMISSIVVWFEGAADEMSMVSMSVSSVIISTRNLLESLKKLSQCSLKLLKFVISEAYIEMAILSRFPFIFSDLILFKTPFTKCFLTAT